MELHDNNEINRVGSLRSDIEVELHTIPAIQIWNGRKKSDDKHQIQSMTKAISFLRLIETAQKINNHGANLKLIEINNQIDIIKNLLQEQNNEIEQILNKVPPGFKISDAISIKPVKLNLFINVPSGYQLVFLLCKFDVYVRKVQLAKHISLISGNDASDKQNAIAHAMRSLITNITRFKLETNQPDQNSDETTNATIISEEAV